LFWDVDLGSFEPVRHPRWLFKRVLEYGTLDDWWLIKDYFGLDNILAELKQVRSLEPRALNFIATLTHTPLKEFKCYRQKPLNRQHWFY